MQHVQNSEVNVENKKKHCKYLVLVTWKQDLFADLSKDEEVVKAFQNALALLNDQMKIWANDWHDIYDYEFMLPHPFSSENRSSRQKLHQYARSYPVCLTYDGLKRKRSNHWKMNVLQKETVDIMGVIQMGLLGISPIIIAGERVTGW